MMKAEALPEDPRSSLTLFMSHRSDLVAYAQRILGNTASAEDVVQEAYLRFDAVSGPRPDAPLRYLYRIVRNLALDGRRRVGREGRVVLSDAATLAEQTAADVPSPESQAIGRDEVRAMTAALAELPERSRIALEMHRFGDCTFRDIADHLGISLGLAHRLVIDALEHCRSRLCRPAASAPEK